MDKHLQNSSLPKGGHLVFLALFVLFVALIGCKPEDKDPMAIVTVVEEIMSDSGLVEVPVANARVRFDPPEGASQPDIVQYTEVPKLTDVLGQVTYVTRYEGIINIKVEEGETGSLRFGDGVILLQKNKVYEEKIVLN